MARANNAAAAALQEYAELFALSGGDAFRVRSYQRAAKAIAGHPEDIAETDVRRVPGVGEAIAKKVEEFLRRGSFRQLDELRAKVPEGVRQLIRVPTLGPKTALVLFHEYGIDSPDALAEAIDRWRPSRNAAVFGTVLLFAVVWCPPVNDAVMEWLFTLFAQAGLNPAYLAWGQGFLPLWW